MIWIPIFVLTACVALLVVWVNGIVGRLDQMEPYYQLGKFMADEVERKGAVTFHMSSINLDQHPENNQ